MARAEPIITTVALSPLDAPLLELTDHGPIGGNVRIVWTRIGPGVDGDALYGFCEPLNPARGDIAATPVFFVLDLDAGGFREVFPTGAVLGTGAQAPPDPATRPGFEPLREAPRPDFDPLPSGQRGGHRVSRWEWARPTCAAPGPEQTMLLGAEDGQVVRYRLRENVFEPLFRAKSGCAGLVVDADALWVVTQPDVRLHLHDEFGTVDHPIPGGAPTATPTAAAGLVGDDAGNLYTAIGPAPWHLLHLRVQAGRLLARRLLPTLEIAAITLHGDGFAAPWAQVRTPHGVEHVVRFAAGTAHVVDTPPAATDRGYTLRPDFEHEPPSVWLHRAGAPERHLPFRFSRATQDAVKTMTLAPDGERVLGAAVPNSAWWSFPADGKGRVRRYGMDYSTYVMLTVADRVYAVGYPMNKFMRWNPDAPWTLDWAADADDPTRSVWHTPWGPQDTNPAGIARLRVLRHVNVRRPSGLALGADGRIYTAGRDHAINNEWVENGIGYPLRVAGCLYWFDPATRMIGYELGEDQDFEHLEVLDLCAVADGRYIALGSMVDGIPMAPPKPNLHSGYLHIWDTLTHRFVHRSSPTGGKIRYVQEAPGGLLVGYTVDGPNAPGKTSEIFVFDTTTMRTVRIIRLPWYGYHSAYASPTRFERGPDGRIYFYGSNDEGTALFRLDPATGAVQPVARGKGITDGPLGAAFLFAPDRVFFGGTGLGSVPLEAVVGPAPPGGWATTPSRWPLPGDPAVHRSPPPEAVEAARQHEEERLARWLAERNAGVPQAVAALIPNVWTPLPPVQWAPGDGPAWASLGHGNSVLCLRPDADGGGVQISVRRVTRFDERTGAPTATTEVHAEHLTLLPENPETPRRRTVHVPGETIRLCLILRPDAGFTAGTLLVEVIQQALDPGMPNTARFMEATNPAERSWYKRESVTAPWASGPPVFGTLTGAGEHERFEAPRQREAPVAAGPRGPEPTAMPTMDNRAEDRDDDLDDND